MTISPLKQSENMLGISQAEKLLTQRSGPNCNPCLNQEEQPLNLHNTDGASTQAGKENPDSACMILESVCYNADSGSLTWMKRPREHFASVGSWRCWNRRYPGKLAFNTKNNAGYLVGSISSIPYLAHRICWLCHSGAWPDEQIDHINRDKTDNRICNLRDVNASVNMSNRAPYGRSALTGIERRGDKWRVTRSTPARGRYIGTFHCLGVAIASRIAATQGVKRDQSGG